MIALRHSLAAFALLLALPVAAIALIVRPAWRRGLWARLGYLPGGAPGCIWLHAASVGEAQAALSLLALLQEKRVPVVATATTFDGLAIWRSKLPESRCSLAPIDHLWFVEWALARVRPSALLLIETEIWPSLIAAACRRRIPVAVASGRLSDRSFARYRCLRLWSRSTFGRLARVAARSERDAEHFIALGVPPERVFVGGDLKASDAISIPALAPDLARALSASRYVVAGSTHAGEESAALAALAACERAGCTAALVLAPRRLARADEVARMVREHGRVLRRRSAIGDALLASGEVLLLDSLGELPSVYAGAESAFVGGTLVSVGGHNVLEPLRAGCPVCFGPHLEEVRENARFALECGAGTLVETADDLTRAWHSALADPEWGRRARAARDQLALGSPAMRRTRAMLLELAARVQV